MKSVIDVLKERHSTYNYSEQNISEQLIKDILNYAQRTSSSHNVQDVSIIYLTEKNIITQFAKLTENEQAIKSAPCVLIFLADYNRSAVATKQNNYVNEHSTLITAAIDVGLLAQSVELVAQGANLATCMFDSFRQNMYQVTQLLNISGDAFPLLAMTIGHPKDEFNDVIKPRVKLNTFAFKQAYNIVNVKKGAIAYDLTLRNWYDDLGLKRISYIYNMNTYLNKMSLKNELAQLQQLGLMTNITRKY